MRLLKKNPALSQDSTVLITWLCSIKDNVCLVVILCYVVIVIIHSNSIYYIYM